jgi:hypothetical protein
MKKLLGMLAVAVPYLLLQRVLPDGDGTVVYAIAALGALIGPVTGRLQQGFDKPASGPEQEDLVKLLSSPFESFQIQKLLPPSLRSFFPAKRGKRSKTGIENANITPALTAGIQNIGRLAAQPGTLSPEIAAALQARFSQASQGLASGSQNNLQQLLNRLAAGNASSSAVNTAGAAGLVSQERGQRGLRGQGLSQTDQLQRADSQQVFNLLDTLLQFISSGRGQNVQGLAGAGQLAVGQQAITNQQQAAQIASLGSALSSIGQSG